MNTECSNVLMQMMGTRTSYSSDTIKSMIDGELDTYEFKNSNLTYNGFTSVINKFKCGCMIIGSNVNKMGEVFCQDFNGTSIIDNSSSDLYWASFQVCPNLTSYTRTTPLATIHSNIFQVCPNLTNVDLSACTSVPTLGGDNFNSCTGCIVKVPSSLVSDWSSASRWSSLISNGNIILQGV